MKAKNKESIERIRQAAQRVNRARIEDIDLRIEAMYQDQREVNQYVMGRA